MLSSPHTGLTALVAMQPEIDEGYIRVFVRQLCEARAPGIAEADLDSDSEDLQAQSDLFSQSFMMNAVKSALREVMPACSFLTWRRSPQLGMALLC